LIMSKPLKKSMLTEVEKLYLEEEKNLVSLKEWTNFLKSYGVFQKAAFRASLPFDPRFNAVHWGFAVNSLCREIAFGFCWMNAYANHFKAQVGQGSQLANVDFHASYFADNCITRIDSCRDKIALMVWAFYCPFNPEKRHETLDYQLVLERLKYPLRFGLNLKGQEDFIELLEILKGKDFDRIETYRNYKIHRIEPRIEIYGVKPHHGWDYMFPLYEKREIQEWEKELEKRYPDNNFREHIKKGCHINGVLFEMRKIKDSLWDYADVSIQIRTSLIKLLKASAGCFTILPRRSPLRKKPKGYDKIGGISKKKR